MTTWQDFANQSPELAAFGEERLSQQIGYLATIRKNGFPRVHPVTAFSGAGRLWVFMEPTSPKGKDIQRNGKYALHCAVEDQDGGKGEFYCYGNGTLIEDAATWQVAASVSPYQPKDRYILFELSVEEAAATTYPDGNPSHQRWQANP